MTHARNHSLRFPRGCLWHAAVAVAVLVIATAGCRGNYPATVPVRGRITYNGGEWPGGGTIYFLPEKPAEAHAHHPGMASFGRDGYFSVKTFAAGDGLAPGTYVVRIECWKVPPQMGGPPPESHLPPDYQAGRRTLPKLVVEPDTGSVWFEYDVSAANQEPLARNDETPRGPFAKRHVPGVPVEPLPVLPHIVFNFWCGSAASACRAIPPAIPATALILRRQT